MALRECRVHWLPCSHMDGLLQWKSRLSCSLAGSYPRTIEFSVARCWPARYCLWACTNLISTTHMKVYKVHAVHRVPHVVRLSLASPTRAKNCLVIPSFPYTLYAAVEVVVVVFEQQDE